MLKFHSCEDKFNSKCAKWAICQSYHRSVNNMMIVRHWFVCPWHGIVQWGQLRHTDDSTKIYNGMLYNTDHECATGRSHSCLIQPTNVGNLVRILEFFVALCFLDCLHGPESNVKNVLSRDILHPFEAVSKVVHHRQSCIPTFIYANTTQKLHGQNTIISYHRNWALK